MLTALLCYPGYGFDSDAQMMMKVSPALKKGLEKTTRFIDLQSMHAMVSYYFSKKRINKSSQLTTSEQEKTIGIVVETLVNLWPKCFESLQYQASTLVSQTV